MSSEFINLFSAGPVVVFSWSVKNASINYISDNISEILGYMPVDVVENKYFIQEIFDKKDILIIDDLIKNYSEKTSGQLTLKPIKIKNAFNSMSWIKLHFSSLSNNEDGELSLTGYFIDVSKEQEIENKLLEEESRYRVLSDYSTDAIFMTDESGKILYINKTIEEALGLESVNIINRKFIEFIPENEVARYLSKFTKTLLGKDVHNFKTYIYGRNKKLIPIEINSRMIIHNGQKVILGVIRDIIIQQKFENELKKLSSVVENSMNGIIIASVEGKIEYANKKYSEITGYSNIEVKGKILKVFRNKESNLYNDIIKDIEQKGTWAGDL